jgi:outer membrane receptor for ferric coprogen and ferric-rhodotorulic acid
MQFHATDALALIGGARVNLWDGTENDFSYTYEGIVTPYLGFTYDINETFTAYGSITSIYKPQLVQDVDENYLDPTFGWNYELGVKAGLFEGAMYASAAVFQTNQEDVAEYQYTIEEPNGTFRDVYGVIDGTTTRGFELEAAGAINERWNASFGYTYATSEDDDGNEVNTDTPHHTLKAATDYRIAGVPEDRLTVGGAVRWQSAIDSIPWDGNLPNIEQDAYAVFDLNASYDVTEQTVLTLSVNNVLDEKYYASTGFYNTVIYGDGIAAELMLRARF